MARTIALTNATFSNMADIETEWNDEGWKGLEMKPTMGSELLLHIKPDSYDANITVYRRSVKGNEIDNNTPIWSVPEDGQFTLSTPSSPVPSDAWQTQRIFVGHNWSGFVVHSDKPGTCQFEITASR